MGDVLSRSEAFLRGFPMSPGLLGGGIGFLLTVALVGVFNPWLGFVPLLGAVALVIFFPHGISAAGPEQKGPHLDHRIQWGNRPPFSPGAVAAHMEALKRVPMFLFAIGLWCGSVIGLLIGFAMFYGVEMP